MNPDMLLPLLLTAYNWVCSTSATDMVWIQVRYRKGPLSQRSAVAKIHTVRKLKLTLILT